MTEKEKELLEELERLRSENSSLKEKIVNEDLTEHSLLGFNQRTMISRNIKMPGHYLFVLKKLMDMRGYSGMEKKIIDGEEFFWLKRGLLCKIFPVYFKTVRAHDEVLNRLVESGLLKKSQQYYKGGVKGSYSYVRITELCEELANDYIKVQENKALDDQLQKSVSEGSQKTVKGGSQKTVKQRPYTKNTPYTKKDSSSKEDLNLEEDLFRDIELKGITKTNIKKYISRTGKQLTNKELLEMYKALKAANNYDDLDRAYYCLVKGEWEIPEARPPKKKGKTPLEEIFFQAKAIASEKGRESAIEFYRSCCKQNGHNYARGSMGGKYLGDLKILY